MDQPKLCKKIITIQNKQYQLQTCIGEGAHASVWKARGRLYPHDELTVKIAKSSQGIAHECLQNEIWFLKEIEHPHIPLLLSYGRIGDYLWLAMPIFEPLQIFFPDGQQMRTAIVSDLGAEGYPAEVMSIPRQYREKTAAKVLADISKVIAYIAGTGIIHADISPGNIMQKKGSLINRQYVLTDWGASALLYRYPEDSFGSLHFTAPERLFGEAGNKSDLFSLGITCFFILTGKVPYGGETGQLYYMNAIECEGITPSDFCSDLTPSLDKLIRDLIHHRPDNRPRTHDVCKRVEKILLTLQ